MSIVYSIDPMRVRRKGQHAGSQIQEPIVIWKTRTDVGSFSGAAVHLRFVLIDADRYSRKFEDSPFSHFFATWPLCGKWLFALINFPIHHVLDRATDSPAHSGHCDKLITQQ